MDKGKGRRLERRAEVRKEMPPHQNRQFERNGDGTKVRQDEDESTSELVRQKPRPRHLAG